MPVIRLLIEPNELMAGTVVVRGDEFHYATRVRRAELGTTIQLFDGAGRSAEARVQEIGTGSLKLEVTSPRNETPARPELWIALALIKGERMDWALSKLVELGATRILPMTTRHTVVRLSKERAKARKERFQKLAKAASRQCRRAHLPEIDDIVDLPAMLKRNQRAALKLMPSLTELSVGLQSALPTEVPESILVLIGPEGGFADEEIELAREAGCIPVSLGAQVLRAETAAIAITSILRFHFAQAPSHIAS